MKKNARPFLLALIACMSLPLPILSFSPYLVFLYKTTGWVKTLWMGAVCGVILDLISVYPLGFHPVQMILITLLVYRARFYFIDTPLGLALYAILISVISTCFSRLFLLFYDPTFRLTLKGSATDFLFTLIGDGVYSLFFSSGSILQKFFQKLRFFFLFFKKRGNKRRNRLS